MINLVSTLPHTAASDVNILEIEAVEEMGDALDTIADDEAVIEGQEDDTQRDEVATSCEKSRLIIPTEFFKEPKYHPLQIFVSSTPVSLLSSFS